MIFEFCARCYYARFCQRLFLKVSLKLTFTYLFFAEYNSNFVMRSMIRIGRSFLFNCSGAITDRGFVFVVKS